MNMKADDLKNLFQRWSDLMFSEKNYLIKLDSVVGDADLGLTMSEGFLAAYNAIKDNDEPDLGKLIYFAGKAMASAVPSTMGTLVAKGFMAAGKSLRGLEELNDKDIVVFFESIYKGVQELGKANPGEKTFLDGMTGSLALMNNQVKENIPLEEICGQIIETATEDFEATSSMLPKHGRAAARGESARSMLDPGAAVAKLMLCEFANSLSK